MSSSTLPTWRVRIPSSTSNLGSGFDLLGLALSMYLDVEISLAGPPGEFTFTSLEGEAKSWPQTPDNVLLRALRSRAGELFDGCGLELRVRSEIPTGRGFGSTGAAVVAGFLLTEALAKRPVDLDVVGRASLVIEGHPDNATASLYGGCTLALPHSRGLRVVQQDLHEDLAFAVAWPASPLPTEKGRTVLPERVPHSDAVENPRRLAMLLEGLRSADPELLALGIEDRLHARFRLALISGGAAAMACAGEAGAWATTVSGSGSGLIALCAHRDAEAVAEALRDPLDTVDGPAHARVLRPVYGSPVVERDD